MDNKDKNNTMRTPVRPCQFLVAAALFVFAAGSAHAADGLFGYIGIKGNNINSIPKWVEVLKRIREDLPLLEACAQAKKSCGDSAMRGWRRMLKEARGQSRAEQLKTVNAFFNDYRYISDQRHYGVTDYWETPYEFIQDSGDCEDYAIAKYYSLRVLGWDDSQLRLVVLHDSVRNTPHAVLSVTLEAERGGKVTTQEMILDNLTAEPLSDKYMMQYTPYYAVNETSRWVFVKPLGEDGGLALQ